MYTRELPTGVLSRGLRTYGRQPLRESRTHVMAGLSFSSFPLEEPLPQKHAQNMGSVRGYFEISLQVGKQDWERL